MADNHHQRRRQATADQTQQQHDSQFASQQRDTPGKQKLKDSDITGLKYFDKLAPLLERLHEDACERDKAGNRELHFDQYCLLILLYLFKHLLGCRHLLSHSQNGIEIQTYCAIIACIRSDERGALRVEAGALTRRVTLLRGIGRRLVAVEDDRRLGRGTRRCFSSKHSQG